MSREALRAKWECDNHNTAKMGFIQELKVVREKAFMEYNERLMKYDKLASEQSLKKTVAGLKERGMEGIVVENRAEALEKIKALIPKKASVMNGASETLKEIGFIDYLKDGKHGWKNLHEAILKENDAAKKAVLRKQAVLSDFYLGSVHALTEEGELVIASNSGSQLPHLVFTSQNLILVVGAQKITPNVNSGLKRLREYVFPLEDARMKSTGAKGSAISKLLIVEREQAFMGRKVHVLIVKEKLGF